MKPEEINQIFRKVAWLDKNRWNSENELDGDTINFSSKNLSNNEKILTHWLCYISDRQMPFAQIWDKGGFVYSDIVNAYTNGARAKSLLDPNSSSSFFRKKDDDKERFHFVSRAKVPRGNVLITDYRYSEGAPVEFIPRYYPSDLKSILQTLVILESFEKNILKYIAAVMDKKGEESLVRKIAFALYLLSYHKIGQPKSTDWCKIAKDVEVNKTKVLHILKNESEFDKEYSVFWNNQRFKQKRVWCALRDYVKAPKFTKCVLKGFKDIGRKNLSDKWKSQKSLYVKELELPGDVWNDNPKFRKCVFGIPVSEKISDNSSEVIRKVFDENKASIEESYPEMFDVTFNFVPRMCGQKLCDFCIFNKNNKIKMLCSKDESKYCPVLLVSCGYKSKCNVRDCAAVNASR